MHFFTSINNAYLPKARILAKSIKRHCKNATFTLIMSDNLVDDFDIKNEPFDDVVTVEMLGLPVQNIKLWIFIHAVVELCTAVKGQALVNLLSKSDKVVYLDPDIVVYDDLAELDNLLDKYDVILTPHLTAPENIKEAIIDNEICTMRHGIYNFGFFAVRNTANGMGFANWYRDRLLDFCYDDIPNGLFTDQKWGDMAPALFDNVHIWRNPGSNVSTWNLTHRHLSKDVLGNYLVNGQKLLFYHFSGFDSGNQKSMLDKYGNGNDVLYELRNWYINHMETEGQQRFGRMPSVYNYYTDGTLIKKEERLLLRERQDLQAYFASTNPFDNTNAGIQCKQYLAWYKANSELEGNTYEVPFTQYQDLRNRYDEILSSKCWKITKPLRILVDNTKRFFEHFNR